MAAAAAATVTTTAPAKLVDLFPGIDEKDKTVPKPKDVVFSFGTAGFRTKVTLSRNKMCARLAHLICIMVGQAHLLESTSFRMGLLCALRSYSTKQVMLLALNTFDICVCVRVRCCIMALVSHAA